MRTSTCMDCCSRCPGCHDICDLYQGYRKDKQRIQDEVLQDAEYSCYLVSAMRRMKGERE